MFRPCRDPDRAVPCRDRAVPCRDRAVPCRDRAVSCPCPLSVSVFFILTENKFYFFILKYVKNTIYRKAKRLKKLESIFSFDRRKIKKVSTVVLYLIKVNHLPNNNS